MNSSDSSNSSNASTEMPGELQRFIAANINSDGPAQAYIIYGVDIGQRFNDFQHFVALKLERSFLTFEEHVQHILALSSVLLLTHSDHPDMPTFIPRNSIDEYKTSLGFIRDTFPSDLLEIIEEIYNQYSNQEISLFELRIKYLELISKVDNISARLISLISRLLLELPTIGDISGHPEEDNSRLITRYVTPIFKGLFDHTEATIPVMINFYSFHNSRSLSNESLFRGLPNAIIESGTDNTNNIGYAEVSTTSENNDDRDLMRLGLFCKDAIDQHHLNCCMAIQARGTNVTFYLVEYINDSLYLMTELESIDFLSSVEDLPLLWRSMNGLFRIVNIFEKKCMGNNHRPVPADARVRETPGSPVLRAAIAL